MTSLFDGRYWRLLGPHATFGLAQGGLVPSYAVIIREVFPAREAGLHVSLAISTTLAGMALGGWLAGAIYDWTGSYAAALLNGIGWNVVNMAIVIWLLQRTLGRAALERDPEKCVAIFDSASTNNGLASHADGLRGAIARGE